LKLLMINSLILIASASKCAFDSLSHDELFCPGQQAQSLELRACDLNCV